MDKKEVLNIVRQMYLSLRASVEICVYWSWGVKNTRAAIYENCPALVLTVSGRLFQGDVLVVSCTEANLCDIYLGGNGSVSLLQEKVPHTSMGHVIDVAIESGTDREEYEQFCKEGQVISPYSLVEVIFM